MELSSFGCRDVEKSRSERSRCRDVEMSKCRDVEMLFYQYINVFLRREDLGRIKRYNDNKNTNRLTRSIHCAPILGDFISRYVSLLLCTPKA